MADTVWKSRPVLIVDADSFRQAPDAHLEIKKAPPPNAARALLPAQKREVGAAT